MKSPSNSHENAAKSPSDHPLKSQGKPARSTSCSRALRREARSCRKHSAIWGLQVGKMLGSVGIFMDFMGMFMGMFMGIP